MSYWYCAECERELAGLQVTFEEKCDTCGHPVIWVDTKNDESIESMLEELKQRRESALRPATKYLGATLREQLESIKREVKEVEMAMMYNDTDDHILEELVDVQTACETMMAILGADETERNEVRRQVIEKNAKRGYYEGAASNK